VWLTRLSSYLEPLLPQLYATLHSAIRPLVVNKTLNERLIDVHQRSFVVPGGIPVRGSRSEARGSTPSSVQAFRSHRGDFKETPSGDQRYRLREEGLERGEEVLDKPDASEQGLRSRPLPPRLDLSKAKTPQDILEALTARKGLPDSRQDHRMVIAGHAAVLRRSVPGILVRPLAGR